MIPKYIHAGCYLRPNPSLNSNDEIYRPIEGSIHVKQLTSGGDVEISLDVSGFDSRALHAFHVHSYGYIGDTGCDDTGGHYNPYGKWHGAPQDSERHVGDLGNIQSDDDGNVKIVMRDNVASLVGEDSIIGRSFVVHVGVDDLGRGGDEGSRTTGNAGPRLACCVIGHIPD
uniref:Superoxide dismutase [Cu-Zn] n=1 Tax=Saccoglossus kowalevskii TaxID=10224 RepID=A0ABM0MR21_SACKO|nr:PREDICTED: superoxide dismutase [Cu-Zn]-like [Saccoglossus kowalevskii]